MATESTKKFSNRAADYHKYRPGYPDAIIPLLQREIGLSPKFIIADIGSGTGISSKLFLQNGNFVFGVEPNENMRKFAEEEFRQCSRFKSIHGTAEATSLPNNSVDLIVAAQAFHWFDIPKTRIEFSRILKTGEDRGDIVLIWNERLTDSSSFLRVYEKLMQKYAVDYNKVRYQNVKNQTPAKSKDAISDKVLGAFFKKGSLGSRVFDNYQMFDFKGLRGRLLSSSYAPLPTSPNYKKVMRELKDIFDTYKVNDKIKFEYHTRVYWGN